MGLILICFTIFFVSILFYNYYWKRRNLPPGPAPYPLLGNFSEFGTDEPNYQKFKELKEKYGDIFTIWAAERPLVFMTDFKLLQDTLIKEGDVFAGRESLGKFNEHVRGGDYGVIFVDGDLWTEHRRFTLQVLRNFGMGRGLMEEKIELEIGHFFEELDRTLSRGETTQNIVPKIEIAVASIINQLLFGFAYHGDEKAKEFAEIKETVMKHMQISIYPGTLFAMHYPRIAPYLPILKDRYRDLVGGYRSITDYCRKQVEAHKAVRSRDSEPSDYVDAYLREAEKQGADTTFTETQVYKGVNIFRIGVNLHKFQLINSLYDMFIAGQETSANTIVFAIIYAINYPEKLKKLQAELDKVIGSDRRITLADKTSLPYCSAFIYETQRLVNLLPSNLPRKLLKDIEVRGYHLPKGTVIIPQISSVLYDENIFPDPHNFVPERFLSDDGGVKKIEEFVPFSMGKRQCLGESLAKMELQLILSNFFNLYNVIPARGEEPPTMKKIRGVTVQPYPFECEIIKRY